MAQLLERIHTPADVKKLSPEDQTALAGEMRAAIVEAVSTNGGHLASNLGVVQRSQIVGIAHAVKQRRFFFGAHSFPAS